MHACALRNEKLKAASFACQGALGFRRGGRVVDRVALEMRSTRKGTGGSNPSLSASCLFRLVLARLKNLKNTSKYS